MPLGQRRRNPSTQGTTATSPHTAYHTTAHPTLHTPLYCTACADGVGHVGPAGAAERVRTTSPVDCLALTARILSLEVSQLNNQCDRPMLWSLQAHRKDVGGIPWQYSRGVRGAAACAHVRPYLVRWSDRQASACSGMDVAARTPRRRMRPAPSPRGLISRYAGTSLSRSQTGPPPTGPSQRSGSH